MLKNRLYRKRSQPPQQCHYSVTPARQKKRRLVIESDSDDDAFENPPVSRIMQRSEMALSPSNSNSLNIQARNNLPIHFHQPSPKATSRRIAVRWLTWNHNRPNFNAPIMAKSNGFIVDTDANVEVMESAQTIFDDIPGAVAVKTKVQKATIHSYKRHSEVEIDEGLNAGNESEHDDNGESASSSSQIEYIPAPKRRRRRTVSGAPTIPAVVSDNEDNGHEMNIEISDSESSESGVEDIMKAF
ncbi:hypothetical protein HK100_006458 [Physocladia obscura]|uniref:Uncharacterized protein n=1 Tax=Physocladia obscura TaxID=109957 RepID=A0AAD5XMZ3_9FUNG|nr:hypothetical protein HK100_006458 [Physocladia obscura]